MNKPNLVKSDYMLITIFLAFLIWFFHKRHEPHPMASSVENITELPLALPPAFIDYCITIDDKTTFFYGTDGAIGLGSDCMDTARQRLRQPPPRYVHFGKI